MAALRRQKDAASVAFDPPEDESVSDSAQDKIGGAVGRRDNVLTVTDSTRKRVGKG